MAQNKGSIDMASAKTHLDKARAALDAGNEADCMKAADEAAKAAGLSQESCRVGMAGTMPAIFCPLPYRLSPATWPATPHPPLRGTFSPLRGEKGVSLVDAQTMTGRLYKLIPVVDRDRLDAVIKAINKYDVRQSNALERFGSSSLASASIPRRFTNEPKL
jgi:hypothetical protein